MSDTNPIRSTAQSASHCHTRRTVSRSQSSAKQSKKATHKTDILISIKPHYMDQIVARTKDHEFRNYLILQKVERMWLYVASPRQILQYIAVISHGKSPGEIAVGSNGLGNADFNARLLKGNGGYAYEIKELYQLHGPVPLKEMQQKYGVTFPQRYIYVTNSMAKEIVLQDQIRIF